MHELATTQKNEIIHLDDEVKSLSRPAQVIEVGKMLKVYIQQNGLSTTIKGKDYASVDAWKFAGMCFGLVPICEEPVRISGKENVFFVFAKRQVQGGGKTWDEEFLIYQSSVPPTEEQLDSMRKKYNVSKELIKEYFNYKCSVAIKRIADDKIVSTGFATCSNMEKTKVEFEEYAIGSMSQTRGIGKGFRNLLGHIMKAAGVESTPSEEMDEVRAETKDVSHQEMRPVLTDEQFARTLAGLKEGTVKIETVEKHYALTPFQIKAIDKTLGREPAPEPTQEPAPKKKPTPTPKKKAATKTKKKK